jgi:hypothetical protein
VVLGFAANALQDRAIDFDIRSAELGNPLPSLGGDLMVALSPGQGVGVQPFDE